ncbi:cold-shock protein (plasmid) [Rhizobium leguminosarum]|uniref:Cold-shock protein n=1 Tax=Rhizobium leguminosarum TaxID=384 RepID=A0A1L3ZQ98_RHILE|nr:cold shock domain-containing protein [Rhizobium leguminosarum]API57760.1 cold-shock protein [Rhizobium leguminosarum]
MPTGKVKWFDVTKGFGFIVPDAGGPDVFLHLSKVQESNLPTLETGAAIQYSLGHRHGKAYAEHLSTIVLKEEKAKPTPRSADDGPTNADPDDTFEKEWGLRRF